MMTVIVTINGTSVSVDANQPLSFRDVADMAGFKHPAVPSMTLYVQSAMGWSESQGGRILHPGESVTPWAGMVFNVADTSNA